MKNDSGSIFVDANVLVYAAVKDDARNRVAKALLTDSGRGILHISPQIITEFYSAITSSKRVTDPYSPAEAVEFIETLLAYEHISMLPISQDVPSRLLALLKTNQTTRPHVFDVQIAATMLVHGLTKLFTYNVRDFRMFSELEIVEPT